MLNYTYHPDHRENFSGRHKLKFYADEQSSRSTEPKYTECLKSDFFGKDIPENTQKHKAYLKKKN